MLQYLRIYLHFLISQKVSSQFPQFLILHFRQVADNQQFILSIQRTIINQGKNFYDKLSLLRLFYGAVFSSSSNGLVLSSLLARDARFGSTATDTRHTPLSIQAVSPGLLNVTLTKPGTQHYRWFCLQLETRQGTPSQVPQIIFLISE